jgi:hypothetical protein
MMACAERKSCAWLGDLNRCIWRSRRRVGRCGVLRAVIQIAAGPVFDIRQDGALRTAIAAQAVGDQALRSVLQTLQQALGEALSGSPIPLLLHQDIQHDAVLIHRSPEIMQHASDAEEHFIEVPRVPRPRSAAAQSFGKLGAELLAPVSDAFVGDHHVTPGQDQFDITLAEAEDVIQPHGVADDLSDGGGTNWALASSGQLRPPLAQPPATVNLAMPVRRLHVNRVAAPPRPHALRTMLLRVPNCCANSVPAIRVLNYVICPRQ